MTEKISSRVSQEKYGQIETAVQAAALVSDHARSELSPNRRNALHRLMPDKAKRAITNVMLVAFLLISSGCANSGESGFRVPHIPGFEIERISRITPTASAIPEITATSPASPKPIETSTSTPTPTETPSPLPTSTIEPSKTPTPKIEVIDSSQQLPKDVIPSRRLEDTYHTYVYNTTDTELFIREGAIKNSPIFPWLQYKDEPTVNFQKENSTNKSPSHLEQIMYQAPRKFSIFLVDGPIVHSKFLTPAQKAQMDPNLLQAMEQDAFFNNYDAELDIEKAKPAELKKYNDLLTIQEQEFKEGRIGPDEFRAYKEALEDQFRAYLKEPSEEDLIAHWRTKLIGYYSEPTINNNNNTQTPLQVTILLPVGNTDKDRTKKVEFRDGDKQGFITYQNPSWLSGNSTLASSQSYPTRSQLGEPNPPHIIKDPQRRHGIALRHELRHFSPDPKQRYLTQHPSNERALLDDLDSAEKERNAGNDMLYYLVLRKKGSAGTPDEIVITQKKPPINSNLNV